MPQSYYDSTLAAERLQRCYELAPPAVQRYLEAEIQHVLRFVEPRSSVLELGCGYGRVLARIVRVTRFVVGIDVSMASLVLAAKRLAGQRISLARMNAVAPAFKDGSFDLVCCPQNGISAFAVDQRALIESSLRVLRPRGKALFFSYADEFWDERLPWFRIQARHGLIGEIDEAATGDGVIVCRDGFRATTVSPARFAELTAGLERSVSIETLEHASVVCEITAQATPYGAPASAGIQVRGL